MSDKDKIIILNGTVITPFRLLKDKEIFIEKEKINSIEDRKNIDSSTDIDIIDAAGGFIVPGFIDIHVHGGGGADAMDGNYGALKEIAKVHSKSGTTAFLPTTMTMSKEEILRSLESISEAYRKGTGTAEILGIHLEGPFINPSKKGAQKEEHIVEPSVKEFLEFDKASGNLIRIVTIAPEMPGAIELIRWLHENNIITSAGHSDATYDQVREGVKNGLTHITHIFNAMRGFNHREPGIVGAALSSQELMIEMIADGVHLHPVTMNMILKVKEHDKIILITDAMSAAGKPEGIYSLGGQEVMVSGNSARLKDGTLAGSILTLDKAITNMLDITGISLIEAIKMVTVNPAKCLGIENKKGSLEPGKDADIVILDEKLEVRATLVKGRVVYKRDL